MAARLVLALQRAERCRLRLAAAGPVPIRPGCGSAGCIRRRPVPAAGAVRMTAAAAVRCQVGCGGLAAGRDGAKGGVHERLDSLHGAVEVADNVEHRIGREVPTLPEAHERRAVEALHLPARQPEVSSDTTRQSHMCIGASVACCLGSSVAKGCAPGDGHQTGRLLCQCIQTQHAALAVHIFADISSLFCTCKGDLGAHSHTGH